MWNTDKWFPGLKTLNRGFGGSQIADSLHFVDRVVLPYRPKTIVFYAGDNDVAAGKKADEVYADYRAFVGKVHKDLPETKILYIAIKPSLARWNLVEEMRKANGLIAAFSSKDDLLEYVDIDAPMLGNDDKPREDLFLGDGLHLNETGYELWTSVLLPFLIEETPSK